MRDLPIAYGNSCYAKKWANKTIAFDELCKRLQTPVRTSETVEEYPKLSKSERDRVKDKGGFVGGNLAGGRRKRENVTGRSMLTLDADSASQDFIDQYEMLGCYASCLYSTHGHRPEAPRVRIIVPLLRDVTSDEYAAIARFYANEWGMDCFDACSYRPHQLMYWPTTPANGEYVFKRIEGDWLDPDAYLTAHPNWKDCAQLPTSTKESVVIAASKKPQEDPLAKEGVVGAFCRAYSITEVITKFLADVYAESTVAGRYDYIAGESSAGVVVYEDKFAYSHHATDPACGKLLNAFDLVRMHRFGDDDEKTSFKQMAELAVKDEKVKAQLAQERMEKANEEFSSEDWQNALDLDKKGGVLDTLDNIVSILRYDEELQHIAFNYHRDGIDAKGGLPWEQIKSGWNDTDGASLKVFLSRKYGLYSPTKTKDAVIAVAVERAYHPIKEYLESLPDWDGVPRVDNLLIDYFGAAATSYSQAAIRKTLVAAVARIYQPGIKFDSVLILNGPQGIGKSTFFTRLAGDWFSDSLTLTDMKDKAGPEKLQGYWILELAELAGMRKADVETVKSFLSRVDDKYRVSYGVNVESHPRQCIIVGSANAENGFLRDITGNRRFWPILVSRDAPKKSWQITASDVQQIWAETLVIYKKGEKLYLEGDDAVLAKVEQAEAMENDEREGLVQAYLEALLPINWGEMDLYERRNFLNGNSVTDIGCQGTERRRFVCNMEIWCECFCKEPSMMKKSDSYEISSILQRIGGWERYTGNKAGTHQFTIYGKQRACSRTS